ncbi:MAG: peptidylprolyl isomerase [Ignavibacteriaceae bacterium]
MHKNILILCCLIILSTTFIAAKDFPSENDSTKIIDFDSAFKSKIGNEVLAKVGNKNITVREFISGYEFGPAFYMKEKNSKDIYLKFLLDEKLLALDGYSQGYNDSVRVKELYKAIQSDLTTEQLFKQDVQKDVKITKKEIKDAIRDKQFTYDIKWLYAPNNDSLSFFESGLSNKISFDSLYKMQLNDSIFYDQRSMKIDKFKLSVRNPQLAIAVDTLKVNEISPPIKAPDGWYIVMITDIWKNEIVSETMYQKDEYDANRALEMQQMDSLSDAYVHKMMLEHNPVIQARPFDLLRSYMGSYELSPEIYKKWGLDEHMKSEVQNYESLSEKNLGKIPLVALNDTTYTMANFINWFRLRDEYLKFNQTNFNNFSASLESLIWQMVRDNLLMRRAYSKGLENMEIVKEQCSWWKDKIVYSIMRDKIAQSVGLNIESPAQRMKIFNKEHEIIDKTNKILDQLKAKYKISINKELLDKITVQNENNPHAIDTYIVKKGGIFPHPAYPSIDFNWREWH